MDGRLVWLSWESAGAPRLVFTTRQGGVSPPPYDTLNLGLSTEDAPDHVRENRARVFRSAGCAGSLLATAGQVHGTTVRPVTDGGHVPDCDGLVTDRAGITLAVSAADCAPVLLWSPRAIAAVHAGWRGAAGGIAGAAVQALVERSGCSPGDVRAVVHVFREGSRRLDLARAIGLDLERHGVREWHDVGRCTSCDVESFFSHRRDRGVTGRQWGLALMDHAHPS
jgi:copper oxidase (laccase) domain-containing protein